MAFLPFSQRAKAWEPIALELRRLANVGENEVLDPEVLAAKVGLCLVDARVALESFSETDRTHLLETASNSWSGGVYPKPLPNGKLICIINPNHDRKRSRITLMEEVVHIHRKHKPSGLRDVTPGLRLREYHTEQEEEAYGVGAAALMPWAQFYHVLDAGTGISDIAEKFDVSEALVEYRVKITGATNLYRSRCRHPREHPRKLPAGSSGASGRSQSQPA
jgi:hypothetical protein